MELKLKAWINGKSYPIVQGATFSEELNETLDSGSIIISDVPQIDIKPFDDVIIYDSSGKENIFLGSFYQGYIDNDSSEKSALSEEYSKEDYGISYGYDLKTMAQDINEELGGNNGHVTILIYLNYNTKNDIIIECDNYSSLTILGQDFELISQDKMQRKFVVPKGVNLGLIKVDIENLAEYTQGYLKCENAISEEEIEIEGWKKGETHDFFFKHLLVDQFVEEILYLGDETGEVDENGIPIVENMLYKYKIQMFSEIKKTEKIILPNISITQPINELERKTIWQYLNQFLDMYNIKEKIAISDNEYEIRNKYELDPNLEEVLGKVYAPELTLNTPTFRELLSRLFIVKDMIPYVKNDVIYGMDISKTNGNFDLKAGQYNYVHGSQSSENYVHNLKRNYSDALSQDSTGRSIEYVGFRNKNSALMTFENISLELEFPIYKINKIYMCYYKDVDTVDQEIKDYKKYSFLCKQDITPLVKLNSERNCLSKDWDDFNNNSIVSIEELAKYRLCTLGYSIGSNVIEGWGEKYSYPRGWWQGSKTVSYLENILRQLDRLRPYGIYSLSDFKENDPNVLAIKEKEILKSLIPVENSEIDLTIFEEFAIPNYTYRMKTMFFIVDYTPFYSGAITHSKNFGERNTFLTSIDNASSSLTLLEQDGISQREKLERYGNKGLTITSRYNPDFNLLQPLGSVYNRGNDKDIIIYHREYSIFNNVINCTYYGTKDYVLKNYYTSVFAKHRTYSLMSYAESVKRNENEKAYLLLSKDKAYREKDNNFSFDSFKVSFYDSLFSFFEESLYNHKEYDFDQSEKYNAALFHYIYSNYDGTDSYGYLLKEVNSFVSGNSLCFNITTSDNVASNPYIYKFNPNFYLTEPEKDFTGTQQKFKLFTDKYGNLKIANFIIGHFNNNIINTKIEDYNYSDIQNYYDFLFNIPIVKDNQVSGFLQNFTNKIYLSDTYNSSNANIIGGKLINKDNKELIDMTYQFETITNNKDVVISPWLLKLSNINGVYKKFKKDTEIDKTELINATISTKIAPCLLGSNGSNGMGVIIIFKVLKDSILSFPYIETGYKTNTYTLEGTSQIINVYYENHISASLGEVVTGIIFDFKKIHFNTLNQNNNLYIDTDVNLLTHKVSGSSINSNNYKLSLKNVTLEKIEKAGTLDSAETLPDLEEYNYYKLTINQFNVGNKQFTSDNLLLGQGDYFVRESYFDYANTVLKDYLLLGYEEGYPKQIINLYYKNMYFVKAPKMDLETLYGEYKNLPAEFSLDNSIDFQMSREGNEPPSISIFFNKYNYRPGDSIRYYYKNNSNSSKNNDGHYHFVYGVNLNQEDIDNGYVKIYISMLNDQDKLIYDNNHKLIGEMYNYLEGNISYDNGKNIYKKSLVK